MRELLTASTIALNLAQVDRLVQVSGIQLGAYKVLDYVFIMHISQISMNANTYLDYNLNIFER